MAMATRRPINPSRRVQGGIAGPANPFSVSNPSKSRSSPFLSLALVILGAFLLIGYFYRGPDGFGIKGTVSKVEGDFSCTLEVQRAIPILKKAYGDSMHKVLHVGPDTCSVVSSLLGEEETEAWGVEPYDIEDANRHCKNLVQRGLVRVADIKFPLPYRAKSFSLVIASDTLEYLSPKYLNKTLPELARVSSDGLIIFTGYPNSQKTKTVDKIKPRRSVKLRSATWWARYFVQTSLEENEAAVKKFDQAAEKAFYKPGCQIFHLKSYN